MQCLSIIIIIPLGCSNEGGHLAAVFPRNVPNPLLIEYYSLSYSIDLLFCLCIQFLYFIDGIHKSCGIVSKSDAIVFVPHAYLL